MEFHLLKNNGTNELLGQYFWVELFWITDDSFEKAFVMVIDFLLVIWSGDVNSENFVFEFMPLILLWLHNIVNSECKSREFLSFSNYFLPLRGELNSSHLLKKKCAHLKP